MRRFIGSKKAERANNCQPSREAKPPHVLQTAESKETSPPPQTARVLLAIRSPLCSGVSRSHLCADPPPCCGVGKGSVGRALAHGARDTLLNPIRVLPEDRRLPVTVSQHQGQSSGRRHAFIDL
ncbi:unnamed protein product [Xyrichtys novacula]|uniref:Unnamed protein product n=1 Tax=Xyrichtys novacula TaxID=13765 RepID=A0AAV1H724_XYRNO|nr:unnamed protein product [Xyrichtys novacula]